MNCDFVSVNLKLFMPFFNRSLNPPAIDYTELDSAVWLSPSMAQSEGAWIIAMFQWLNLLNPDWKHVVVAPAIPFGPISGEGVISINSPSSISLTCADPGKKVDLWWNSTSIGKFGVVGAMKNGFTVQPLTFINSQKSVIDFGDEGNDGIYYNLSPGVTASGAYASYGTPPYSIGSVPPVYWWCDYGTCFGSQNLQPGATPYGYYGPEILP